MSFTDPLVASSAHITARSYERDSKAGGHPESEDECSCPTLLCATHFDDDGMLRLKSSRLQRVVATTTDGHGGVGVGVSVGVVGSGGDGGRGGGGTGAEEPLVSFFWAAGFAFTTGDAIAACPYDVHHKSLFFGEEQVCPTRNCGLGRGRPGCEACERWRWRL